MKSAVVKRSIVIAGHKTSVSLEDDFWNGLKEIGREHKMTLANLVGDIDVRRLHTNLSSAIRLFVFGHFRAQLARPSTDRTDVAVAVPTIAQVGRGSQQANGRISEHHEP
jgi:predicted DNA-binding ribbon-helix-helix protein